MTTRGFLSRNWLEGKCGAGKPYLPGEFAKRTYPEMPPHSHTSVLYIVLGNAEKRRPSAWCPSLSYQKPTPYLPRKEVPELARVYRTVADHDFDRQEKRKEHLSFSNSERHTFW
jgi:hypothetical protein